MKHEQGKLNKYGGLRRVQGITVVLAGLVFGFMLCVGGRNGFGESGPGYSPAPGPFRVEFVRYTWHDAARDRDVPVKIYYPATGAGPFPVIIFSHGLGGTREGYEYLGRCWASHGYVSVHVQHIGSDRASVLKGARDLRVLRQGAAMLANAINRPKDISFAIDQMQRLNKDNPVLKNRLDLERIGVGGHSFGAYTALAIAGEVLGGPVVGEHTFGDPRVKAVIPMSAPVPEIRSRFAEAFSKITIPCFHMTGTKDNGPLGGTKAADRRVPFDYCNHSDQYLITFKDGDHMVFSGPRLLRGNAGNDARFHEIICAASVAFWDAYLKGDVKAKTWLTDGGLKAMLGVDGRIEEKVPLHTQ